MVEYKEDYLTGFTTEAYQVSLADGFQSAKVVMDGRIHYEVRSDIGGDEQRVYSVNTQYNDVKFKHILLPIWMNSYRYKDKVYRFLVNGLTGEVQGERPWSAWKIIGMIVTILAVIGGGIWLYSLFKS